MSVQHETARDKWIGAAAAERIANGEALESIETEPLEALGAWIEAELQDRIRRQIPYDDQFTMNLPF